MSIVVNCLKIRWPEAKPRRTHQGNVFLQMRLIVFGQPQIVAPRFDNHFRLIWVSAPQIIADEGLFGLCQTLPLLFCQPTLGAPSLIDRGRWVLLGFHSPSMRIFASPQWRPPKPDYIATSPTFGWRPWRSSSPIPLNPAELVCEFCTNW